MSNNTQIPTYQATETPAPTPAPPRTHDLKTWPEFFDAIKSGAKTFEVRLDDRGFKAGDTLMLRKWDPSGCGSGRYLTGDGQLTGVCACAETILARVSYVLAGWGIKDGVVCMALQDVRPGPAFGDVQTRGYR